MKRASVFFLAQLVIVSLCSAGPMRDRADVGRDGRMDSSDMFGTAPAQDRIEILQSRLEGQSDLLLSLGSDADLYSPVELTLASHPDAKGAELADRTMAVVQGKIDEALTSTIDASSSKDELGHAASRLTFLIRVARAYKPNDKDTLSSLEAIHARIEREFQAKIRDGGDSIAAQLSLDRRDEAPGAHSTVLSSLEAQGTPSSIGLSRFHPEDGSSSAASIPTIATTRVDHESQTEKPTVFSRIVNGFVTLVGGLVAVSYVHVFSQMPGEIVMGLLGIFAAAGLFIGATYSLIVAVSRYTPSAITNPVQSVLVRLGTRIQTVLPIVNKVVHALADYATAPLTWASTIGLFYAFSAAPTGLRTIGALLGGAWLTFAIRAFVSRAGSQSLLQTILRGIGGVVGISIAVSLASYFLSQPLPIVLGVTALVTSVAAFGGLIFGLGSLVARFTPPWLTEEFARRTTAAGQRLSGPMGKIGGTFLAMAEFATAPLLWIAGAAIWFAISNLGLSPNLQWTISVFGGIATQIGAKLLVSRLMSPVSPS